jgi:putative glutamine amidotransferase
MGVLQHPWCTILIVPRIVAVTCDRREGAAAPAVDEHGRTRPLRATVFVQTAIVERLRRLGAEPILVPPIEGDPGELVTWLLESVQGIVLTGGPHDIDPALYGEGPMARIDRIDRARSNLELELARGAWVADLPLLGLCGGMQAMAVALGGALFQDIRAQIPSALEHEQPTDPATTWHSVVLEAGHLLRHYGRAGIEVNSTHHQAVKDPGPLAIVGRAPDGVVEAIEGIQHRFFVGVQWHPELFESTPYEALIAAL